MSGSKSTQSCPPGQRSSTESDYDEEE
jgi:hypothetical protein